MRNSTPGYRYKYPLVGRLAPSLASCSGLFLGISQALLPRTGNATRVFETWGPVSISIIYSSTAKISMAAKPVYGFYAPGSSF